MRNAYAPLAWQCRYGGVEVPDNLWKYCTSGKGKKYSDNQVEDVIKEDAFMQTFNTRVKKFENFFTKMKKVTSGKCGTY